MNYRKQSSSFSIEVKATVCGGFPVLASGDVLPPDDSVGWGGDLDNVEITTLKGKPCPWIEKKMTALDWESIKDTLWNSRPRTCRESY